MGKKNGTVDKKAIQKKFQRHEGDTGSSEVQIALLSKRIELLTGHLTSHKKDHSSRYGLIKMVSARRRLLDYLKRTDEPRYKKVIKELSIRH
ncbi:MAG: 30S ribosomal protein S15 [Verrucomicrobia bacterium]|nr:30S ribosomal protein S15 [Verrucomicrobiota bacterium]